MDLTIPYMPNHQKKMVNTFKVLFLLYFSFVPRVSVGVEYVDHFQYTFAGSVIGNKGCISPPEVYVRIDNDLYSGGGQAESEHPCENGATPTSRENIYNDPVEIKEERPSSYEFDSPLYASSKESD